MGELFGALSVNMSGFLDTAKQALTNFGPKDIIDILLLTVIFILVFRFLKGRKAGALIVGIIICFIIVIISDIFELNAVHKIFSSIIGSGMIVVIVIFQPEIREALEKLGSGSIKGIMSFSDRKKKKELYFKVIEQICDAVEVLSSQSTGALIVIERTTRLSDITQSGIKIDAEVNSHLIRNIFYNRAPLHDGAIVIADGRLEAAGCFLPLTRRTGVDTNLGTRHRAAIGMSETSDAIIVVVSEETGAVSIAHDCALKRNITIEELKDFLMENILRLTGNSTNE